MPTLSTQPQPLSTSLVPTFRSSCSIAAPAVTSFGKSWALANLLILVPLIDLKSLKDNSRLVVQGLQIGGTSGKPLIGLHSFWTAQAPLSKSGAARRGRRR